MVLLSFFKQPVAATRIVVHMALEVQRKVTTPGVQILQCHWYCGVEESQMVGKVVGVQDALLGVLGGERGKGWEVRNRPAQEEAGTLPTSPP